MQLIIVKHDTDILITIEVPHDADRELVSQMIQSELGIPAHLQQLEYEDAIINTGSLAAQGIADGCAITVKTSSGAVGVNSASPSMTTASSSTGSLQNQQQDLIDPASMPPEQLLAILQQNPRLLQLYKHVNEELGAVLEQNDPAKLRMWIMKQAMSRHKIKYEARLEEIALASADPMDPEVQKKIAEKVGVVVPLILYD
jgi:hypothetical protein